MAPRKSGWSSTSRMRVGALMRSSSDGSEGCGRSGTLAVTVVPRPGAESTCTVPPSRAARSRMVNRP